jgi:hypothetical protein
LGVPRRSSLAPAPLRPVPSVALPRSSMAPIGAPAPPPVEDWRAARDRVKAMQSLGTVSEEGGHDGQGSPSAANVSRMGTMGPPARGPLGESRFNPTASGSTSRLSMPTAASAAKAVNGDISLSLASGRESSRRESMAHVSRTTRINATSQYRRPSLAPQKPSIEDKSDTMLPQCLRPNGLGQPARRRDSVAPPSALNANMSMSAPTSGSIREVNASLSVRPGPRDSMSASTSLGARGGLKSRASIADFGAKAGNSSMSLSSRPSMANLKASGGVPRQWR